MGSQVKMGARLGQFKMAADYRRRRLTGCYFAYYDDRCVVVSVGSA